MLGCLPPAGVRAAGTLGRLQAPVSTPSTLSLCSLRTPVPCQSSWLDPGTSGLYRPPLPRPSPRPALPACVAQALVSGQFRAVSARTQRAWIPEHRPLAWGAL